MDFRSVGILRKRRKKDEVCKIQRKNSPREAEKTELPKRKKQIETGLTRRSFDKPLESAKGEFGLVSEVGPSEVES
jgi:hypothetical protein